MQNEQVHKLQIFAESLDKMELEDGFVMQLPSLFSFFFEIITEDFNLNFTSLFSRISYSANHYNFPIKLTLDNHYLRKKLNEDWENEANSEDFKSWTILLLWRNLKFILPQIEIPTDLQSSFIPESRLNPKTTFHRIIKAMVLRQEGEKFVFVDQDVPTTEKIIGFTEEIFQKQLTAITKDAKHAVNVNFIDVNQVNENDYEARALVIQPDYLIGVTSISECFNAEGSHVLSYLMRKLLPTEKSIHMLTGNIVNYFLDELIHDSSLEFDAMLPKIFQLDPMAFLSMSNDDLRTLLSKLQTHFAQLKKAITTELSHLGITKDKAYLEPSFYSAEYGLQGRLDLYYHDPEDNESDIIELKSGKLFKANNYGLNENHFMQTLLYDLLLESVNKGKLRSKNYILYSSLSERSLRYAPRVRQKQINAMALRNEVMLIESMLSQTSREPVITLIKNIVNSDISDAFGFLKRDINAFKAVLSQMDQIEKEYYIAFLGFLNRELNHSKLGEHGAFKSNGLASLWLDSLAEKKNTFRILNDLNINENNTDDEIPILSFSYSENSNVLSRFRIGDIAVLYPSQNDGAKTLNQQLFKCTIINISEDEVSVRLRARQKNYDIFNSYAHWNIESDVLDSSFNKMFHGLFSFLKSTKDKRDKILCLKAPERYSEITIANNRELTEEQNLLLKKAVTAKDYFLLWGPPGTGKTSRMIKSLVQHYFEQTDANIYLLAFTNRAVDEICKAVDKVLDGAYLRIGSRYSTPDEFKSKLLSVNLEKIQRRRDLIQLINEKRVFVSTVSSFQSVQNLSQIKPYDLVIVDEASQLLEPQVVAILSQFKKFILIGDHKQLPAVVAQSTPTDIGITDKLKATTGLVDMSNSLFERMISKAKAENWDWAYGQLTQQGRMHKDILGFVGNEFYEGELQLIEGVDRLYQEPKLKSDNDLKALLINKRMIFIDAPLDSSFTHKLNKHEADMVVRLVELWKAIYTENNIDLSQEDIGVITPFRSQIALINQKLPQDLSKEITLDTIERYQGGSRNQIIISMAISQAQLLDSVTNVSDEGIDRKLNVALSRAKENLIIIGSKIILSQNPIYKKLIEACFEIEMDQIITDN